MLGGIIMHMADALISPIVGGTLWVATVAVAAYSIKKVENDMDEKKIPLMGVMGAFVFAAQMINFSIPGTGSSGHLGGGLLLSILLRSYAGFLTMASVLIIQALFFADGGLLALGCNIINMGFYTCFIAYPFIYKRIMSKGYSKKRIFIGAMIASIIGLQFGAFSVVMETVLSGKAELPFTSFVLLMQPIHIAIGAVEGLVVAAVVTFVFKARPEIIERSTIGRPLGNIQIRKVIVSLGVMAILVGVVLSWFASANPDGLEWSMFKASGKEELVASDSIHKTLGEIQDKTAFLPGYDFKATETVSTENTEIKEAAWPSVSAGTSASGVVGGGLTLILISVIGFALSIIKKRNKIKVVRN